LFCLDNVHLSPFGETFLSDHIVMQAYMFAASRGHCVKGDDLNFGNNVATYGDGKRRSAIKILSDLRLEAVVPEPLPLWRHQRRVNLIDRFSGGLRNDRW
jgi:hypothetical protein